MNKFMAFIFLIFISTYAYSAEVEISTVGRKIGIGTTSRSNTLSIRTNAAIGSATYTSTVAPDNGLIVEGNVGIGTINPTEALEVNGTVVADDFVGDGSGLTGIVVESSGFTDDGTIVRLTASTDTVGIGTANPTGHASNSAGTGVPGDGAKMTLVGIGTTLSTATLNVMNSTNDLHLTVLDDGSIGIGKGQNPFIDPNDNIKIRPKYNDSNQVTSINAATQQDGAGNVFGVFAGAYHSATVTPNGTAYGIYGQVTDTLATEAPTGNYYGVFGTNYLGGALTRTNKSYGVFANGPSPVAGTALYNYAFGSSGWNIMAGSLGIGTTSTDAYTTIAPPSGGLIVKNNIGIGTFEPSTQLHVVGGARITGLDCSGNTNGGAVTASSTGVFSCTDDDSGGGGASNLDGLSDVVISSIASNQVLISNGEGFYNKTVSGDITIGSTGAATLDTVYKGWTDGGTNIYLTLTTDNVGIGTTTPNAALLVENVGTQASFRVNDSAIDASPFIIDSVGNVGIGTTTASSSLIISNANTSGNLMSIVGNSLTNGNALGITASGSALAGNVVSITTNVASATTGVLIASNVLNASQLTVPLKLSNVGSGNTFWAEDASADATPFIINNAGNVGIGTTTPNGSLIVASGNVGIGTLVPLNALQVNGKFQIDQSNDMGWSVVDQTDNQACNDGCISACVFGIQNATGVSVTGLVGCTDTTSDLCLCAGPN